MPAVADGPSVQFGQSVHKVMLVAFQAVVHAQVDDFQFLGHVVAFQELAGVAVGGTEEQHVNRVERQLVCEDQVRLAVESLMDVGNPVARIARTVHKLDVYVGMVQQQADQLACRVSRTSDDAYLYHTFSSSLCTE